MNFLSESNSYFGNRKADLDTETPWLDSMSSTPSMDNRPSSSKTNEPAPTIAPFSPTTYSHSAATTRQRSTILVHQKSPLLVATPPQVTRALAYSHPFLLPLNKLAGLLSWSTGDPWESFLLIASFWAIVLYGDVVMRWAGPLVVVVALIFGMYSRRYSPLSSTGWSGEKQSGHNRSSSESNRKHYKSLDEIVETLKEFTARCNILLDPLLRLTEFLSTQRTATSATTRPALTALFVRILIVTPIWVLMTFPPFYIITTRRTVLLFGTLALTWHSRPARVSRVILWRSLTVRRVCSALTGLSFSMPSKTSGSTASTASSNGLAPPLPPRGPHPSATALGKNRARSSGVRFTFIIYENQRRWLGIGWTYSLLAYERAAWTDEHLNPSPSKDEFELPEVEGGHARWRWVEDSEWQVEGSTDREADGGKRGKEVKKGTDTGGWIYYDNKWNDGRRGADSWGRYTRRRKWYRDAELVEVTSSTEVTPSPTPAVSGSVADDIPPEYASTTDTGDIDIDAGSMQDPKLGAGSGSMKRRTWFRRGSRTSLNSRAESVGKPDSSGKQSVESNSSRREDEEDDPKARRLHEQRVRSGDWGIGDEAQMGFG